MYLHFIMLVLKYSLIVVVIFLIAVLFSVLMSCNTTNRHRTMTKSSSDSSRESYIQTMKDMSQDSSGTKETKSAHVSSRKSAEVKNMKIKFAPGGNLKIITDSAGNVTYEAAGVDNVTDRTHKQTEQKDSAVISTLEQIFKHILEKQQLDSSDRASLHAEIKTVNNELKRSKTPWYMFILPALGVLVFVVGKDYYVKYKKVITPDNP